MAKKKPEIKKTTAAAVCVEKDFGIGKFFLPMKHYSEIITGEDADTKEIN